MDDLTLMQSRFPGAAAWYLKQDGALSTLTSLGTAGPHVDLATPATSGNVVQLVCLREFSVGFTTGENFGQDDERLIFECIIKPENNGDVAMDWFVGMVFRTPTAFLIDPELITQTGIKRYGFAIDGDTNIYGISANGTNAEVTPDHDLIANNTIRHLKAVYILGIGIEFFVDGVSIGTLPNYFPTDQTTSALLYQYAEPTDEDTKQIINYKNKIYFQNGA